jgi:hypothetical protein
MQLRLVVLLLAFLEPSMSRQTSMLAKPRLQEPSMAFSIDPLRWYKIYFLSGAVVCFSRDRAQAFESPEIIPRSLFISFTRKAIQSLPLAYRFYMGSNETYQSRFSPATKSHGNLQGSPVVFHKEFWRALTTSFLIQVSQA